MRRDGHIVSAVIIAVDATIDGRRGVLGMAVGNSEAEPFVRARPSGASSRPGLAQPSPRPTRPGPWRSGPRRSGAEPVHDAKNAQGSAALVDECG